MMIILAAVGAYLLGCVPAGRLVEQLLGERAWTRWAMIAADALKGVLAVSLLTPVGPWSQALTATAVLAGHLYPITGDESRDAGLSVAAGALSVVSPVAVPVYALLWAIGFVISGYQALGAGMAVILFAPAFGFVAGWPLGLISVPVCVMLLERLRPALRRVVLGTEPRHLWRTGG